MKKTVVTITCEDEKLAAIRLFLTQKGLDLEQELAGFMEQLFKRHVPKNVQEYLELKDCIAPASASKKRGASGATTPNLTP